MPWYHDVDEKKRKNFARHGCTFVVTRLGRLCEECASILEDFALRLHRLRVLGEGQAWPEPVVWPILFDFVQDHSFGIVVKMMRWLANVVLEGLMVTSLPFQCHLVEIAFGVVR
jgi:hypothetical protein